MSYSDETPMADEDLQDALGEIAASNELSRKLASDREDLIVSILADDDDPGDYDISMPSFAEVCATCGVAYIVPNESPHHCNQGNADE